MLDGKFFGMNFFSLLTTHDEFHFDGETTNQDEAEEKVEKYFYLRRHSVAK